MNNWCIINRIQTSPTNYHPYKYPTMMSLVSSKLMWCWWMLMSEFLSRNKLKFFINHVKKMIPTNQVWFLSCISCWFVPLDRLDRLMELRMIWLKIFEWISLTHYPSNWIQYSLNKKQIARHDNLIQIQWILI